MCGFAGIFSINTDLLERKNAWLSIVRRMGKRLMHFGEISEELYISSNLALSCLSRENNTYPVSTACEEQYFATVHGIIYDTEMLRNGLQHTFSRDKTTAELVLQLYKECGDSFIANLDGVFSGFIVDFSRKAILLFGDALGRKPLYYTIIKEQLVFASEIKGILEFPGVVPLLSKGYLFSCISCNDIASPKKTVFEGIDQLFPGNFVVYSTNGLACYSLPFIPRFHAERSMREKFSILTKNINFPSDEINEEKICGLLLETAIIRDYPSLSAQEDILLLSLCKKTNAFGLLPEFFSSDSTFSKKEIFEVLPNGYKLPPFGALLKEKLQAYIRDRSQPVHLLLSEDNIKTYLLDAEKDDKKQFFFLQLCLWMNHYKVRIPN